MTISPYLLLLETSTILQTDLNTWQAIAKLGECLLPEVVALEIKNIANGKAEGNEAAAKQFQNMLSLSQLDWQITPLIGKHPQLILNNNQNISRKARLILNVAQSAIGVANAHPQQCIVLISDEISLRDRIAKLDCPNLCAIPSAIARQWSRTNQAPPIVQQLIQKLKVQLDQIIRQSSYQTDTIGLNASNLKSPNSKPDQLISLDKAHQAPSQRWWQIILTLLKFGLSATFLVAILLFGWQLVQPQQFQQFWEKTGITPLKKIFIDPSQPKKTQKTSFLLNIHKKYS